MQNLSFSISEKQHSKPIKYISLTFSPSLKSAVFFFLEMDSVVFFAALEEEKPLQLPQNAGVQQTIQQQ